MLDTSERKFVRALSGEFGNDEDDTQHNQTKC